MELLKGSAACDGLGQKAESVSEEPKKFGPKGISSNICVFLVVVVVECLVFYYYIESYIDFSYPYIFIPVSICILILYCVIPCIKDIILCMFIYSFYPSILHCLVLTLSWSLSLSRVAVYPSIHLSNPAHVFIRPPVHLAIYIFFKNPI